MSASVLLVDDDRAGLFALQEVVSPLGARVQVAETGEDALRQVLKQDFAAIVLDVRLPGMDGFEVAAAIRSLERARRTPIVFVSAHEDRRLQPRDGTEERFLRKPLEPDIIRSMLAELLAKAHDDASEPRLA